MENFFANRGPLQHEIGFYVWIEPPDPAQLPEVVLDGADTAFLWVPLDQVRSFPVLPVPVAELLDVPAGQIRHLVTRETAPWAPDNGDLGATASGR